MGPDKHRRNLIQAYSKIALQKRIVENFRGLENPEREVFLNRLKEIIDTWAIHQENLPKIAESTSRFAGHTYLLGAIQQVRRLTRSVFQDIGITLENKDLKSFLGGNPQRNLQTIYDSCKSEPPNLSGRFISSGSKLIQ